MDNIEGITNKLAELRTEHRDLDDAIAALIATGTTNLLQVKRLKKQKLFFHDQPPL